MKQQTAAIGYLPDEKPDWWKLLLYALQQVVVMFPATVTVALITGFQVSVTIFASGLATLCFILITGRKIPLYYGSSFAYLSAILALMSSEAMVEAIPALANWGSVGVLPVEAIPYAQLGIIMSGFVSIGAGLLVRYAGPHAVEKILPATISGSVAMIIGLTLVGNAMGDAFPAAQNAVTKVWEINGFAGNANWAWVVALVTLLSTILFSRYLKGFASQLPLLLGALCGCATAALIRLFGGEGFSLFRAVDSSTIQSLWSSSGNIFSIPRFTTIFEIKDWGLAWSGVLGVMIIAIATIPESTAHIYQLDIYVNDLAKKKGKESYPLSSKLDRNLIGDGLCDMVSGFIGGPAGTNYGENISAMAITKVFSIPVLLASSVIAMVIACFTPLIQVIYAIPQPVIGGLEIYLFGAIAAQGIAILIDKKADMFSAKNIAVIATVMTVGIGGQYKFGGIIPFFGINLPCIAGAAVFGILLNLVLSIGDKKKGQPAKAEGAQE
ncbi:MAG: solute carrier family 23 protein [Eubacteriales bacterium]